MITQAELKEHLAYNPDTGEWFRHSTGQHPASRNSSGYRQISINKTLYSSSKLAFLYMAGEWPSEEVDHINLIRHDDRWCNLRQATRSENSRNKSYPLPKSGVRGVERHKNKWRVTVRVGDTRHKKLYSTLEEAAAAVKELRAQHHGQFARD